VSGNGDLGIFQRGLKYAFQALGRSRLPFRRDADRQGSRLQEACLVAPNIAFGQAMINLVPPIARGFGQSIVFQDYYRPTSATSRRRRAHPRIEPDVVMAMSFPNDSVGLLRVQAANYAPKMFYEAVGAATCSLRTTSAATRRRRLGHRFNDTFKETARRRS